MEYRKLSKGGEMISTLGLSMGGIHKTTPDEIEAVIRSHCTCLLYTSPSPRDRG